ncbi:MAG: tRNA(Ile)-lysidine synthase [Planctomycetota bacterium]|jgi:tRNA(Ile)-lysidine synthetase-like protein
MRAVDPRGALLLRAGRHPLAHEVERNLRLWCTRHPAVMVDALVAVSGGADSMALLTIMAALQERGSGPSRIAACCVHHHLRPEADRELESVRAHCDVLKVPFLRRDVHPAEEPGNLAAAARRLRYEALTDCVLQERMGAVLTAHHADDQLETVLMSLCRGGANFGLGGMRWSRRLGEDVLLMRPLLDIPKARLVEFVEELGVPWHHDASNEDPESARGMLRTKVLPHLLERWPKAAVHVAHTAEAIDGMGNALRMSQRADPESKDYRFELGGMERAIPEVLPYLIQLMQPPSAQGDSRFWAEELLRNDPEPRVYDAGPDWELRMQGGEAQFTERAGPPGTT